MIMIMIIIIRLARFRRRARLDFLEKIGDPTTVPEPTKKRLRNSIAQSCTRAARREFLCTSAAVTRSCGS